MAEPITADDVQAYLAELGYSIPMALLAPILCSVNEIIPCMEANGYDECTQQLILLYASALMSASSGARRIKSEGAPSGASRSFDYGGDNITWLKNSLSVLDTAGCADDLPIKVTENVGFFDVVGGIY